MEGVSTFGVYVLQPVAGIEDRHISKHQEKAAATVAPSPSIHGSVWG